MDTELPGDLLVLDGGLEAAERDARALVDHLTEAQGMWRVRPGSWSVAECLDHLATGNRIYLDAMRAPAERARERGRVRKRPARPGVIGRTFVWILEPPVKPALRLTAPRSIRPRPSPPLADAIAGFLSAQDDVRRFLRMYSAIDLAGVRFPNPFIHGVRFSLATGLHVIVAHERRHLLQAWRVRNAQEAGSRGPRTE